MYIAKDFINIIVDFLPKIPVIIISLLIGWLVIKVIILIIKRALRLSTMKKDVSGWIVNASKVVLWSILIIVIASGVGFSGLAVALTGSAAITAFVFSVSLGPTLSNIFSGMFLSGDVDIEVGMKVITNSGKTEGTIVSMDMRKVRIRDKKGVLHVLPNSTVENDEWIVVDEVKKR
ncbi:MAG: mechanosensitive ion channel family protein [Candidatus Saccharibacteria bacterium]|nr:mechanosensitive ion channel family protein [Candidatus Saccharibacteria bacterium]